MSEFSKGLSHRFSWVASLQSQHQSDQLRPNMEYEVNQSFGTTSPYQRSHVCKPYCNNMLDNHFRRPA